MDAHHVGESNMNCFLWLFLSFTAFLAAATACVKPSPPMIQSAQTREAAAAESELIVIKNDGLVDADNRAINHCGTIIFLNETTTGPVTIKIHGDFSVRERGDYREGVSCLTVQGIVFSSQGAQTPTAIPQGGLAATCIDQAGVYNYEVRVADQIFTGKFRVKDDNLFQSKKL